MSFLVIWCWALAVIHIAAVFLDWALTGEKLISAMVHGRKRLGEDSARQEPPLAGRGRGIALAVVIAALLAVAIQQTDFRGLAGAGNEVKHDGEPLTHGGDEDRD